MEHKITTVSRTLCALLCGLCLSCQAAGQALPDGKGKAEFVHNCTACHHASMVVAARKTPKDWRKSVDEMAARGTDGTKEDLDNVVLYLNTYFALDEPAPPDTKQSAPSTPAGHATLTPSEIEHVKHIIAENGCLLCHRIDQQGAYTGPSLNGVGSRRSADEIRAAIVHHHSTSTISNTNPPAPYERKITGEDLDNLTRYLLSLPPLP